MMPPCSYGISGGPWQRAHHMSIYLLYHLRLLVLLSLHIVLVHFLGSYTWNVGGCLIGHHQSWRFQPLGAESIPLHSHQMASASSQARAIEQFMCGTPRRERQQQARLLDTRIRSGLWHSRQMASASSQARRIEQFVCGTLLREGQWRTRLLATRIRSSPWHSRQMASASSQALSIEQFVCGTPLRESQRQARLLDTRIRSFLWHSRQMASTSSQARRIEQFVCGTP